MSSTTAAASLLPLSSSKPELLSSSDSENTDLAPGNGSPECLSHAMFLKSWSKFDVAYIALITYAIVLLLSIVIINLFGAAGKNASVPRHQWPGSRSHGQPARSVSLAKLVWFAVMMGIDGTLFFILVLCGINTRYCHDSWEAGMMIYYYVMFPVAFLVVAAFCCWLKLVLGVVARWAMAAVYPPGNAVHDLHDGTRADIESVAGAVEFGRMER